MNLNEKKVWDNCLSIIEKKISPQSFHTWFSPIIPLDYKNNTLTIKVPNRFFYEWLESHYKTLLKEVIGKIIGLKGRLIYKVLPNARKKEVVPEKKQVHEILQNPLLNKRYTFDNFVVWDGNEVAHAASVAISDNPGKTVFNPLVIHAPSGMGKSHVIQAIYHKIKQKSPQKKVHYMSGENFTTSFVKAIKEGKLQPFVDAYTHLDVLIMDDIQFLGNKGKTQEIFFSIFNHLHQNGKQIVMTSDASPKNLEGFDGRLISRFKWGLVAEILRPNLETRIAIIKSKLAEMNCILEEDIIDQLAHTVSGNIREIEGAITSLMAHASLNKGEVNPHLVDKVAGMIVRDRIHATINAHDIQKIVSKYYNVSVEGLRSKTRTRAITSARHLAMYLVRFFIPDLTLSAIGERFGRRDHSSVSYALTRVEKMGENDKSFKKMLENIKKEITQEITP